MIISSSFSYLFFSLALFQCFVILPVLYRSAPLFHAVLVVLAVFRCSDVVPSFRECSVFRQCSVVPAFYGYSMFQWCSVVLALFRSSTGVLSSVVPCSGVPGFIVCLKKEINACIWINNDVFFYKNHDGELGDMSCN